MAFTTQQTNRTSKLLNALDALKGAYYELLEEQEQAGLIGVPGANDFPAPGELDHLTRARLQNAHGVPAALKTFMTTAVVLFAGNPAKSPLDAIVEPLRT